MCDFLLSHGVFWYFSNSRRGNNLSTPLPLVKHEQITHWQNITITPGTSPPAGHSSQYWPERAGGHLQRGWGQTYNPRCDPHWCKWQPDETASPQLCRYRGWERVQWAPVQIPRCTHTRTARTKAVITCRCVCPWWQRFRQELKAHSRFGSEVCSLVFALSLGLLESKQDVLKWCQGQSLMTEGWFLWMEVPVISSTWKTIFPGRQIDILLWYTHI